MSDIFKDSCLLHWDRPQDDGGSPLTHYLIEQMDVSSARGAWRDVGEISADSQTFKVQHLEEKNKYKFRIRAVNKIGHSEPADLQETVLAKDPWGTYLLTYFILLFPKHSTAFETIPRSNNVLLIVTNNFKGHNHFDKSFSIVIYQIIVNCDSI